MGKNGIISTVLIAILFCALTANSAEKPAAKTVTVEKTWEIGEVISAFPVGFSLVTKKNRQFAAYYDKEHRMTVASRSLGSDKWEYKVLPCKIGWDSHNYVTMAFDREGHLHLCGNMHCNPLIYFRSAKPWDISTLERVPSMCSGNEKRCTYPLFMEGPEKELIFHYRDGHSGNGKEIYNIYDCNSKTWSRLLDKPLIDGEGKMNAYMTGPTLGPDGWFYLSWVWRDTYECETNHDPSCARSRDLKNWESLNGTPLPLPITIRSPETLIDSIAAKGGILNGCLRLGFDSAKRPIATYHKFDAEGNTQAYAARFDNGKWTPEQISNWNYRWYFEGGGSIGREVSIGEIKQLSPGKLSLPYSHKKHGSAMFILDEETLKPIGKERKPRMFPKGFGKRLSSFPGIRVKTTSDKGDSGDPDIRYVLRWEALLQNRDHKPPEPHPAPSKLVLYKLMQRSRNKIEPL